MSILRILGLQLENFKGISKLDIQFDSQVIVLGGKNGYGKTTLFDALELVITGEISRYKSYQKDCHNNNFSLNKEEGVPLVDDKSVGMIVVAVQLLTDNGAIRIRRCAEIASLENPISFEPFSHLEIMTQADREYRPFEEKDSVDYGLMNLFASDKYDFLHYISQEESTLFLKSKEADRSKQVQALFNTRDFDTRLEQAQAAYVAARELKVEYNNQIVEVKKQLKLLTDKTFKTLEEETDYQSLFPGFNYEWDKEHPNLCDADYEGILKEDGTLRDLMYYVNNRKTYYSIKYNEFVAKKLSDPFLSELCFYLANKKLNEEIAKAFHFYAGVCKQSDSLSIDNLDFFDFTLDPEYVKLLDENIYTDVDNEKQSVLQIKKSADRLAMIYTRLSEYRKGIGSTVKLDGINTCPVCGNQFEDNTHLIKAIQDYTPIFEEQVQNIKSELPRMVNSFKERILKIMGVIKTYLQERGLSQDLCTRYHSLNVANLENERIRIEKVVKKAIPEDLTEVEIKEWLKSELVQHPIDAPIDVDIMNRVHQVYSGNKFSTKMPDWRSIQKKYDYLVSCWSESVSNRVVKLQKEQKRLELLSARAEQMRSEFSKLVNDIKTRRTSYIEKMISDVEILFYIYSGRIMQDCYYGRGVFLKYAAGNRILFVSSNYKSDVDVLFKMSSGQMASVMIAFMLTINKLYANKRFFAIDDPVQTIDDINMWGLIETLRHNFSDTSMLLSTHEEDYGILLCDKFKAKGISTRYYDMMDLRKNL